MFETVLEEDENWAMSALVGQVLSDQLLQELQSPSAAPLSQVLVAAEAIWAVAKKIKPDTKKTPTIKMDLIANWLKTPGLDVSLSWARIIWLLFLFLGCRD
jgi:hypothetical protein